MREKVQEDKPLIHRANHRVTGATVHSFNGLLQRYVCAIYMHNHNVDDELSDMVLADSYNKVRQIETQLRFFK